MPVGTIKHNTQKRAYITMRIHKHNNNNNNNNNNKNNNNNTYLTELTLEFVHCEEKHI
jgi:hypothetical protein